MRAMVWAIAAGAVLALPADSFAQAGRASGSAQGRVEQREGRAGSGTARGRVDSRERYERRDDRDRDRRYERDRRYDRDDRYDRDRRDNRGPKFCRDGRGHPVHGRAWCRDKGFDRNDRWDRDDRWSRNDRWDRVDWGRVIFRRNDRRNDRFSASILRDLLGDGVFGRLDDHRRRRGYASGLDGRWDRYGNGHVLQVLAGGVPLAQLIDANRDGHVEAVLLNRR